VAAVARIGRDAGEPCPILEGARATNDYQVEDFVARIVEHYGGGVAGKRFGVWGMSFKPRTDDIRNAPALGVIQALLDAGAEVSVYDPVAGEKAGEYFEGKVTVAQKMYACVAGVDGLIVTTEWREFHHPDFDRMHQTMQEAVVFDGRNLYSPKMMARLGFHYHSIGRPDV
jgi:UDPglucose 6-dehydrogenase